MSLDGWAACGSCEAARFGEDVEASDSIDKERCLLRLFVGSFGVNEGELEGDGGVSIALVVVVGGNLAGKQKSARPPAHIRHRANNKAPIRRSSPCLHILTTILFVPTHRIPCDEMQILTLIIPTTKRFPQKA